MVVTFEFLIWKFTDHLRTCMCTEFKDRITRTLFCPFWAFCLRYCLHQYFAWKISLSLQKNIAFFLVSTRCRPLNPVLAFFHSSQVYFNAAVSSYPIGSGSRQAMAVHTSRFAYQTDGDSTLILNLCLSALMLKYPDHPHINRRMRRRPGLLGLLMSVYFVSVCRNSL